MKVHKEIIAVAVKKEGRESAESLGTINNNPEAKAKLVTEAGIQSIDSGLFAL